VEMHCEYRDESGCDVLKEAEHGPTVSATESPVSSDAAVGQLIDFDAETPPPAPTNAMANLCMFHSAAEFECCWLFYSIDTAAAVVDAHLL